MWRRYSNERSFVIDLDQFLFEFHNGLIATTEQPRKLREHQPQESGWVVRKEVKSHCARGIFASRMILANLAISDR
ncbi:MAG: hypothetical protein A3G80_05185 [Betaproteobacteria bacterium RIFCSPLOWO2_12_FULL_62_13b]|nr:MAG: hypothetical protein A3G80_05185 [Betaproteobacteria bacterium RIFCSPLOWO2_12_FULL_62_13b]